MSWPDSKQKKGEIVTRYGSKREEFLKKFNPELQMTICKNPYLCFLGDAPALSEINMAYGEMTAAMWLVPQLYNLSEFSGCKNKLSDCSLEECASIIAAEFYYLKVSELMLFFYRFKSGRYGRFYGSVDPLVITTSLREFVKERNNALEHYAREEKKREWEEHLKTCVSYEDYVANYKDKE